MLSVLERFGDLEQPCAPAQQKGSALRPNGLLCQEGSLPALSGGPSPRPVMQPDALWPSTPLAADSLAVTLEPRGG